MARKNTTKTPEKDKKNKEEKIVKTTKSAKTTKTDINNMPVQSVFDFGHKYANNIEIIKLKETIKNLENTINEIISAINSNNDAVITHINDLNNRLTNLESNKSFTTSKTNTPNNLAGNTNNRPKGKYIYVGFKYWDIDLNKEIIASEINGDNVCWRENDGAIAGVKRIGSTLERPKGNEIYVGFKYYDTTINRLLIAIKINGNNIIWMNVQ